MRRFGTVRSEVQIFSPRLSRKCCQNGDLRLFSLSRGEAVRRPCGLSLRAFPTNTNRILWRICLLAGSTYGTPEQSEVDGAKRSETLRRTRLVREQAFRAVSPPLPAGGRDDQSQGTAPRGTGPHQQGETPARREVAPRPVRRGLVRAVPRLRRGRAHR